MLYLLFELLLLCFLHLLHPTLYEYIHHIHATIKNPVHIVNIDVLIDGLLIVFSLSKDV
jgi:hypothetical protein